MSEQLRMPELWDHPGVPFSDQDTSLAGARMRWSRWRIERALRREGKP